MEYSRSKTAHAVRWLLALALGTTFALGACHDSSGSGPAVSGLVVNERISALSMTGQGELWILAVSEAGEGVTDLNGDGDLNDTVPFAYDLASGSLTNLRLALANTSSFSTTIEVDGALAAFHVSEFDQGSTDLNGDGDTFDFVLHVYDHETGEVTSMELSTLGRPAVGDETVAFAVFEEGQADTDLDGDGATLGFVLHVYDAHTGVITNERRSLTSGLEFHDQAFAFTTDEPSSGADLNGDGDQLDLAVFEVYDLALGGIRPVPLAIRDTPLAGSADTWFVQVDELQSGEDLDGDGDLDDWVLHEVHPRHGTWQSLGLSNGGHEIFSTIGALVAFEVLETEGFDRNGDGDTDDSIAVIYDAVSAETHVGRAIDSGRNASRQRLAFLDTQLAFLANEHAEGLDLNGDGDLADDVLHFLDGTNGQLTNSGLDANWVTTSGGLLVFGSSGVDAGMDCKGSVFYRDPILGQVGCTELDGSVFGASTARILVIASEAKQGEDLNGDGDELDDVYVLHEPGPARNTNLSVAMTNGNGKLLNDGRGVVLVDEAHQSADLNGDGDLDDSVLHMLALP